MSVGMGSPPATERTSRSSPASSAASRSCAGLPPASFSMTRIVLFGGVTSSVSPPMRGDDLVGILSGEGLRLGTPNGQERAEQHGAHRIANDLRLLQMRHGLLHRLREALDPPFRQLVLGHAAGVGRDLLG